MRKLRKAGMNGGDLLTVFKTMIRSVADFASPTYHSLLTRTQSNLLESLQRRALKIIYGHETSYKDCLAIAGIQTLQERREGLVKKFAVKTSKNHRFSDGWFPEKPITQHNTRQSQKYLELRPRTERMKRNPIYHMRRVLNSIS